MSEEKVRSNYTLDELNREAEDPEFARNLKAAMRRQRMMMDRNPHPYFITIPNPAWQEWMDEHSKEQPE